MTKSTREIELDILRIVSAFAVVFMHTGNADATFDCINGLMNALVLWCIPCFVMISGRFMLDPDRIVDAKKIKKHLFTIICAFIFWNFVYQIVYISEGRYQQMGLNWKGIIFDSGALAGPYHFWFLWMIMGLYLVTPFLRKITESKKLMEYFIILFFTVEFINRFGEHIPYVGGIIRAIFYSIQNREAGIFLALGFSGYYILGYYLKKYPIERRWEWLVYLLGTISLIACAIYRGTLTEMNEWQDNIYSLFSPQVILFSSAIYTFCVKHISKFNYSLKSLKLITDLQENSFGIYLIHVLIIEAILNINGLYCTDVMPEPFMRLIRTVIVFCISTIATRAISKIPWLRKYII